MTESQIWLIAAIVLFILEIITPGFVLANFGVAAIGAAIAGWLGGSLEIQTITFIVVCLLSFITVRPLLRRTIIQHGNGIATGIDALPGKLARVTESIPGGIEAGRVQIDGDSWRALSDNGQPLALGSTVRVVRADSNTLIVQSVEDTSSDL